MQNGAGNGELLHPRGEVRRLAHRGVVHVQVGADGPHHHLARVHPDADADGDAVLRVARPRRTASTDSCMRSAA